MTTGDMDVSGLQNVIWPGFSFQLRWTDPKTIDYQIKTFMKSLVLIKLTTLTQWNISANFYVKYW